jgi:glycosyltransferase involved in cell wall biosynthesis
MAALHQLDTRAPTGRSVAIVHDYLNQPGGAERVVLEMARIFPDAPIYTSLFRPDSTWPGFDGLEVRTSFLDKLPVDRGFRALLPAYPAAFKSLGTLDYDVVISSSSGWAHSVRTTPESLHLVYCYAPARWLYTDRYVESSARRRLMTPVTSPLRRWDRRKAASADGYITIADNVRQRVLDAYGIDSAVVHPPVDIDRFRPTPRGERLLVVSRLIAYKRIELVVEAATRLGIPLDVVGDGPHRAALEAIAGPSVTFHGKLPDEQVTALMQAASAVCFPGQEDFGIVPVEANAAGKPVVAFAAGGALETLEEGFSGVFFHRAEVGDVMEAIRRVYDLDTDPAAIALAARRFSPQAFAARLNGVIESRLAQRQAPAAARFARRIPVAA